MFKSLIYSIPYKLDFVILQNLLASLFNKCIHVQYMKWSYPYLIHIKGTSILSKRMLFRFLLTPYNLIKLHLAYRNNICYAWRGLHFIGRKLPGKTRNLDELKKFRAKGIQPLPLIRLRWQVFYLILNHWPVHLFPFSQS